MNFPRIMRAGIAILPLILLAIIVRYFIIRSLGEPQAAMKTDELTQQKIEKKDKIVHIEIKGENESVRFTADRHYVGEDNNYHAEGNVEIILFKKREGRDVFIDYLSKDSVVGQTAYVNGRDMGGGIILPHTQIIFMDEEVNLILPTFNLNHGVPQGGDLVLDYLEQEDLLNLEPAMLQNFVLSQEGSIYYHHFFDSVLSPIQ